MTEIWKHRQFPITVEIGEQTIVHRTEEGSGKRPPVVTQSMACKVIASSFQFGHRRAEAVLDNQALALLKLMLTVGGFVPVTPEAAKGAAA